MGIVHSPLWLHGKSHQTVRLQDMSHSPRVTELSCMQKEQCRCKAKAATICTLRASRLVQHQAREGHTGGGGAFTVRHQRKGVR